MIGFFYSTFLKTGWLLLPLLLLGFWGWWELLRFALSMYVNGRYRRHEWQTQTHAQLERILSEFTRSFTRESRIAHSWRRLVDWLIGLPAAHIHTKQQGTASSWEADCFKVLSSAQTTALAGSSLPSQQAAAAALLLRAAPARRKRYKRQLELAFRCFYLQRLADYQQRLKTLRLIATLAPLLGLLGTVVGMIDTFEVISSFGNSNPLLLADGISKALLTTQAGLAVAFPLLFFYVFARRRLERLRWRLQCIFSDFMRPVEG